MLFFYSATPFLLLLITINTTTTTTAAPALFSCVWRPTLHTILTASTYCTSQKPSIEEQQPACF